jgi:hypothetical protein
MVFALSGELGLKIFGFKINYLLIEVPQHEQTNSSFDSDFAYFGLERLSCQHYISRWGELRL